MKLQKQDSSDSNQGGGSVRGRNHIMLDNYK